MFKIKRARAGPIVSGAMVIWKSTAQTDTLIKIKAIRAPYLLRIKAIPETTSTNPTKVCGMPRSPASSWCDQSDSCLGSVFLLIFPQIKVFAGALRAPKKSRSEPLFLDVLGIFIFLVPEILKYFKNILNLVL